MNDGHCTQRRGWERLKAYEDTGLPPLDLDIINCIIQQKGREAQTDKAIEEMAELAKALLKYRHKGIDREGYHEAVQEEICDVYIALMELARMYGDARLRGKCEAKMERLERRLRGEEEW